eukprot:scaffold25292_cov60-Phaeocystis_antarctica.AAC.2
MLPCSPHVRLYHERQKLRIEGRLGEQHARRLREEQVHARRVHERRRHRQAGLALRHRYRRGGQAARELVDEAVRQVEGVARVPRALLLLLHHRRQ